MTSVEPAAARPLAPVVPPGDMAFYDNDVPALDGGSYYLQVAHSVQAASGELTKPFGAAQEIVVVAPQVALDPSAVLTCFPPPSATGRFGDVLPHVVLADPILPWERAMNDPSGHRQPWLALLVFSGDELEGATTSPTRVTNTTTAAFLHPDAAVRKPDITLEADIDGTAPCAFIQTSTAVFHAVTPRLGELRFLAHCRQVNVGDKPELGLQTSGLFAVVVANRFPAVPPPGSPPGAATPGIAHLVSLEGLEDLLVDTPDFGGHTSVAMLSLASFTFSTQAEAGTDFRDLVAHLVASETDEHHDQHADALLLRLRPATPITARREDHRVAVAGLAGPSPAAAEATRRLKDGFVPLEYRTRSGEATMAWYRGPFSPVPTTPPRGSPRFATGDAAMAYAPTFGVFDLSLAGAFATGRALAVADRLFGQELLDLRRRLHDVADGLWHRLVSDHFSASQIEEAAASKTVHDEFRKILDEQLLADAGQEVAPMAPVVPPGPPPLPPPDPDPQAALAAFLADPRVGQELLSAVEDDAAAVAAWLGRLILLGPVPFVNLLPSEALLPVESLRFFYLDRTWVAALVDGALSIGIDSSRTGFYASLTRDMLHDAAYDAARVQRDVLAGRPYVMPDPDDTPITGFLLRSAIVSGWPTLEVRASDAGGHQLPTLRSAQVAPTVLLCLFWGVPHEVELAEPTEGLRFGTDDAGAIGLRNPIAPDGARTAKLGEPLRGAPPFPVIDFGGHEARALRDTTHRVLNLGPGVETGMLAQLAGRLTAAVGSTVGPLGPADLAVQLLAAPDAVTFRAPVGHVEGDDG